MKDNFIHMTVILYSWTWYSSDAHMYKVYRICEQVNQVTYTYWKADAVHSGIPLPSINNI